MQPDPATDHAGRAADTPKMTATESVVAAIGRAIDLRLSGVRTERAVEASNKLDTVLAKGIAEGKRVSKLGEIAARIAEKKASHDAKADEWAQRLDALDRREPAAFAIGDAVIEERELDLHDMERNMRQISNLPNVVSGKS